jgi:hypothetical protein
MRTVFALLLLTGTVLGQPPAFSVAPNPALRFQPASDGGFQFDTGVLRGRLRAGGESVGLTQVFHVPTGHRLDRSKGLLSHYRVFTRGRRYGDGAWDWHGTATLHADGAVEVRWPATDERPFELRAVYRWRSPASLEVETVVTAREALTGFESFLACYFDPAFQRAAIRIAPAQPGGQPRWQSATRELGDWQMYPRDAAIRSLIEDGRWQLEPHPVAWTFPASFAGPVATAIREAPTLKLRAEMKAPPKGCNALATPYETEGHFSTYASLFGRDLRAGETARARVRLTFRPLTEGGAASR